jgi:hypothetical protein
MVNLKIEGDIKPKVVGEKFLGIYCCKDFTLLL